MPASRTATTRSKAWAAATEAYGAALAKHQTEWFRIHRDRPFAGYRWHFFVDWWGWAGGGLLDVDREPKATYHTFRAASRPLLVAARTERSVVRPGIVELPIFVVNDRDEPWRGEVTWAVHVATSAVVAPDPDGFRIGLAMPGATEPVAVPRSRGRSIETGSLAVVAVAGAVHRGRRRPGGSSSRVRPERWCCTGTTHNGAQENVVHLHCPAPGEELRPGLQVVEPHP